MLAGQRAVRAMDDSGEEIAGSGQFQETAILSLAGVETPFLCIHRVGENVCNIKRLTAKLWRKRVLHEIPGRLN